MTKVFTCRRVSKGKAQGNALRSQDAILFYHTDPQRGIITEKGHALEGKGIAGSILIFPSGKGSSVVQADGMYRLDKHRTAPKGLIVQELDTVLVSSAIIMEMPMVYKVEPQFYEIVRDGDTITLDADKETVTIEREDG